MNTAIVANDPNRVFLSDLIKSPNSITADVKIKTIKNIAALLELSPSNTHSELRSLYITACDRDLAPISDKILTDAVKEQGTSADVAMRQLVNKGIGMVKFMAARSNGLSYDDACSRGLEGLWTAAMKYDSDKGASFITYARKWVYRNTRNRGNKSDISLPGLSDKWIPEDTSNSLPSVESWSLTEDIQGAIDKIDEQSRAIIKLRFFEGMKIDDIGKELGISKPTVISRITKAKEKLRVHLRGYEHG